MTEVRKENITPTHDFLAGFELAAQLAKHMATAPGPIVTKKLMEKLKEMKDGLPPESLGATGKFPQDKLTPNDEGELQLAIGVEDGVVIIHMGMKPIAWFGMNAAEAYTFGTLVQNRAYEADKEKMTRAAGDCKCEVCGDFYRRHPMDHKILGVPDHTGQPAPFLHRLCDGRRVKL